MNKRKLGSLTLCALLFALSVSADAQQTKKVYRIGYLISGSSSSAREISQVEAFRQGL